MKRALCHFIYYKLLGWKAHFDLPDGDKYVMCVAPHTSNWDFLLGKLCSRAQGISIHFLMKKEWFTWPLGYLFKSMGGIPVERSKNHSLVEKLSEQARQSKVFHLAITPEGTRSANANWKMGFYYIARGAGIPIVLISIDYKHKCIWADKTLVPSENAEDDMRTIKQYYSQFQGKHPRNFAI